MPYLVHKLLIPALDYEPRSSATLKSFPGVSARPDESRTAPVNYVYAALMTLIVVMVIVVFFVHYYGASTSIARKPPYRC